MALSMSQFPRAVTFSALRCHTDLAEHSPFRSLFPCARGPSCALVPNDSRPSCRTRGLHDDTEFHRRLDWWRRRELRRGRHWDARSLARLRCTIWSGRTGSIADTSTPGAGRRWRGYPAAVRRRDSYLPCASARRWPRSAGRLHLLYEQQRGTLASNLPAVRCRTGRTGSSKRLCRWRRSTFDLAESRCTRSGWLPQSPRVDTYLESCLAAMQFAHTGG